MQKTNALHIILYGDDIFQDSISSMVILMLLVVVSAVSRTYRRINMGLIKRVTHWSYDNLIDYLSVNPTRDEVTHYKVDPENESDESIIKLHTVKDFGSITCLDYSESEIGMIGVGEKNGYLRIFNISGQNSSSPASHAPVGLNANNETSMTNASGGKAAQAENIVGSVSNLKDTQGYPVSETNYDIRVRAKKQRCINSLGINTNGLIAMGLDRNKHDSSLQIWDMNYHDDSHETINPMFSYCTNESIVSLKFLNDTSVLAASTKFLKEIDVRSPNPIYQHPTRLTYDIKLNPFNDWQFSTYGDDGTLAIWDRRKLSDQASLGDLNVASPLLTFEKLVGSGAASRKYMNSCFRWSCVRNNEFATLHRGDTIKRWRLGYYCDSNRDIAADDDNEMNIENLFVSSVHDTNTMYDRVATFDYIPRSNNGTSLICMRQSGTIYRMPISEVCSKAILNNRNSLLLSNFENTEIDEIRVNNEHEKSNLENVKTVLKNLSFEDLDVSEDYFPSGHDEPNNEIEYSELSEEENDGSNDVLDSKRGFELFWKPEKLLEKDISVIMRTRASLGYGLDPMNTVEMIDSSKNLQNNAYIRNTWRWIAIAKASVDDGTMVSGDLDLGYEGVIGIWNGINGISNQDRYRQETILSDKQLNKEMEKIIKLRRKNRDRNSPIANAAGSPKYVQRRLCLIISGWDLSRSDYEDKYNIIMKNGHYEKAAAWAVFFGDIPKAVEILGSAKKERLRLIATAIAGYLAYKDLPGNNAWRQQCRKMSSELDDPYLRVIFAFIADNDWWDILYEPAISLRERLGVALRFLNDTDLTTFLDRTSSTVIENGELEGLILTGITPNGIDLLQSYVNKTSDVQSAALISIFGSPRYFRDQRVDEWIQTYRDMLKSWELFSMRARFDVLRSKLSRTKTGVLTADIKPRQIYIQCQNCKQNINTPRTSSPSSAVSTSAGNYKNGEAYRRNNADYKKFNTGSSEAQAADEKPRHKYCCPHCGSSFPRCAICLMPLGTSNLPFVINGTQSRDPMQTEDSQDGANRELVSRKLKLNEWFSFCLSCNHGMHAGHAEEWFDRHNVCPTPGCTCQCNK